MSAHSQSMKIISGSFHKATKAEKAPPEMKLIKELKTTNILDLSSLVPHSSHVLYLPEHLIQLANDLNPLEITNHEVSEFSQMLSLLLDLKKSLINKTSLSTLPNTVEELKNLTILNLSNNKLQELPESLSELKNLTSLNLSNNELCDLPISYSKLQRLRELNISKNRFKSIPKCVVDGMGVLRILDISNNICIKMNIIPCSKYLEKFYACNNKNCGKFPDWILTPKFYNITEFYLDKTSFDIFSFIGKQSELHLTSISMTCSNLSNHVLDIMLDNMVNLEKINVGNENEFCSGNVFNTIPISVLKCPEMITELNFRNTALPSIPSSIKQLSNLKLLDIGLNSITWLPEEFCELHKLESLKIDGNGFIMFPENFGNLSSLKEIRAENNIIVRLPDSFKNLKTLQYLDMYNNEIKEFPTILCNMTSLKGIDLEQNYCSNDDQKIGDKTYQELLQTYKSNIESEFHKYDMRQCGVKFEEESEQEEPDYCYHFEYWSEEENEKLNLYKSKDENEENWDDLTDTDGEFDPENTGTNYNERSKQYPRLLAPLGFCPADLHSEKIKKEVASMRVYGSLPSFKIVEGQFDDA